MERRRCVAKRQVVDLLSCDGAARFDRRRGIACGCARRQLARVRNPVRRLRTLLELAATTGRLRRVFVWGSFVTAKSAPRDLDILPIMVENFEVDCMVGPA
jgi:hypothetical protein